jgi:hypothetical protein
MSSFQEETMRGKSTLLLLFTFLAFVVACAPLAAQTVTFTTPVTNAPFSRCDTVDFTVDLTGFQPLGFDNVRVFVGFGASGASTRRDITPGTITQNAALGTGQIPFSFNLKHLPNTGSSTGAQFTVIVNDLNTSTDVTGVGLITLPNNLATFTCARALVDKAASRNEFECPVANQLRQWITQAQFTTSASLRCQYLQAALNCVRTLVNSQVPGGLRDPAVSIDPLLGNFRWRRLIWGLTLTQNAQARGRLLEDELVALLALHGC